MMGKSIVAIAALTAGTLAFTTSAQGKATVPQKCASAKQKAVTAATTVRIPTRLRPM